LNKQKGAKTTFVPFLNKKIKLLIMKQLWQMPN
jgi:hypothetical protein